MVSSLRIENKDIKERLARKKAKTVIFKEKTDGRAKIDTFYNEDGQVKKITELCPLTLEDKYRIAARLKNNKFRLSAFNKQNEIIL